MPLRNASRKGDAGFGRSIDAQATRSDRGPCACSGGTAVPSAESASAPQNQRRVEIVLPGRGGIGVWRAGRGALATLRDARRADKPMIALVPKQALDSDSSRQAVQIVRSRANHTFSTHPIMSLIMATESGQRSLGYLAELALLLLLAMLWGASYTFIKLGVESIPPVTLIAARTTIAAVVLLGVLRWHRISMPTDLAVWRRLLFQACLNSVIPFTLIAWAEQSVDAC